MDNADLNHLIEMKAGNLSFCAENRIATAHVRHHRMVTTLPIAQRNLMFFTGVTAIHIARPLRQETAEDTVFGVKNRQMMISNDFKALTANFMSERRNLIRVQVVRRRDPVDAKFEIGIGAYLIGDVEAEISDQWVLMAALQRFQQPAGANQNRAVQPQQKIDDPLFLGFEDTRTGNPRTDPSFFNFLNRRAQPVQIQIIQRDAGRFDLQRRV